MIHMAQQPKAGIKMNTRHLFLSESNAGARLGRGLRVISRVISGGLR